MGIKSCDIRKKANGTKEIDPHDLLPVTSFHLRVEAPSSPPSRRKSLWMPIFFVKHFLKRLDKGKLFLYTILEKKG
jgi:hypothetical protein